MASLKLRRKITVPSFLQFNHLTLKGVIIILVLLSALQLYISNNFVSEGEKIKTSQTQAEALEAENLRLVNQMQQASSLSHIEKLAQEAGFVKIQKIEYLGPEVTVASR